MDQNDPTTTKLIISGTYVVTALVATADVPQLKHLSWCYEQAKGNVYTMDPTMELPDLLQVKSPRIYLWKYVVYIHTGRVAKMWKRANILDHRFNHGSVAYLDTINVTASADT